MLLKILGSAVGMEEEHHGRKIKEELREGWREEKRREREGKRRDRDGRWRERWMEVKVGGSPVSVFGAALIGLALISFS